MIDTTTGLAVVIGATGAVGGAIREQLRSDGLPVIAVARDDAALRKLADHDPGVVPCPADIGSDEAGDRIRAACDGGSVCAIVQATGLPAAGPLDRIEPTALGDLVALKLGGLLRAVRAVDDLMGPRSRIVAIGGHFGSEPDPRTCGAGITNAALANLVRQLADHYGPREITSHLIAPGPLDTDRLRRIAETAATERGVDVDVVMDEYRHHSPLGRLTTVDDVAWAASLLLAPQADALLGSTLGLDSGARRGLF